jgi:hypothetical protein
MKTLKSLLFPAFMFLLLPLTANNPDHGSALIERIRNNTDYPINIEGKKTIHDLLPAGTVVRIKSRKADYGNDGKYYAVRKERGGYFLKADTTDSSDKATELVVKRHFSNGEDSLGFYSATANKQMLRASDNQAVQFTDKSFASDDAVGAQWKISGGDLKFCYLQNRKTTGFLSPLTAEDQRDTASEIETKKINQTPRTGSESERQALEQQSLMLSFGDTVRIVHNKTLNQIYGDQSRYKHSDSSGNAIVFAAKTGEPDANTWIIKGPHDDEDRFNAPVGTPIESGAAIRLEHVLTGKNLHCTQNSAPPASGGSEHQFEVSLFGNDGVGNDHDNWNISAYGLSPNIDKEKLAKSLEGLSNEEMVAKLKTSQGQQDSEQAQKEKKKMKVGQTFILNHSATEASLFSENVLFNLEPGGGEVSDERFVWQVEISTGTPAKGQKVRYRDKIRLRHTVSNKYLESSEKGVGAVEADTETSQTSWRIKGAHKDNERWNARNEFVENKSVIRLESRFDGKNLYSDNRQNSRVSKKEDGFFFVGTQQIGEKGVGNEEDNWQLEIVGASGRLLHGSKIILNHQKNLKRGESSQLFSHSKELELETNEVAAKKYVPRKKVVQSDTKSYQRVSTFNTQNKDRLALQEKRNLLKKEDDKKYATKKKALKEKVKNLPKEEQQKAFENFEKEKKEKNPELANIEIALKKDNDKMAWFIDAVQKEPLPTKDIAWTGFPNGSPTEEGANETISIEIVTLGLGGNVPPKATVSMGIPVEERPPTISGYATDNVKGFDQSYLLNLAPMLSKGVAWLEKSLENPGKASLSFLVKTEDQGDAQIVFGTELGLDFVWKVLIGAGNNTNSQIIKKDLSLGKPREIVVAKVEKTENPLAVTKSGNFMPYWISINDGEIIVGAGYVIGKDVFMTWSDPEPRAKISRIGFATHQHDVQFTGVQIGSPVGLKLPYRRYTKLKGASTNSNEPAWLSEGLRIPGQGTFGFYASGEESLTLTIASPDAEHKNCYALTLTSDEKERGGMELFHFQNGITMKKNIMN